MSQLGTIVRRLAAGRAYLDTLKMPQPMSFGGASHLQADLIETTNFGANPGALRMFTHIPAKLPADAPLVVVLHGCGQTASDYAEGAGWLALADQHRFAVLAPEQQAANNQKTCFNWFQPEDTTRGSGEAASIAEMIGRVVADHRLDRRRIFVTGLSAGGAMTAAMLALYPDLFAAGAIVAGLPFRAASNVPEAFEAMFQVRRHGAADWGNFARAANPTAHVWPRVAIWQGAADHTVVPGNADELVKQWTDLHGLRLESAVATDTGGVAQRRWTQGGTTIVEEIKLAGVAHGTPVAGPHASGPRPYMLDVGVASSEHIAQFFGVMPGSRPIRLRSRAPNAGVEHACPACRVPQMSCRSS